MLKNYTMSKHLREEREDRLLNIAMHIGFGEIVKETYHKEATIFLSNTGIAYVVNKEEKYIITVYIATPDEVCAMYNGKTPEYLLNKARKNLKYR